MVPTEGIPTLCLCTYVGTLYGMPYFLTIAFSDVPAHLKKGLDMGFNLQGHLDTIDDAIQITHTTISKSSPSKESLHLVKSLQEPHEPLKTKVKALHASLNMNLSLSSRV